MARRPRYRTAYPSWKPVANATGYRIYWGTTSKVYSSYKDVTGGNQYYTAVPSLRAGIRYYFAGKSVDAAGMSPYSNEVVYTP